jgi:hypothetical protein
MTSDPRRPPPKTVQDLVDRNYTIYSLESDFIQRFIEQEKEKWYA